MDLEALIIVVFCVADDLVRDLCRERRPRQRGPAPVLADGEGLTVEIVGESLGLDTDRGLHARFRRHFGHLSPGLRRVHRATFPRQAANLWVAKHALRRRLLAMTGHDPAVALIDSMPVPVCRFARAHRRRGFRGFAAFGHDPVAHQAYHGLGLHLRVARPGVITAATLAPANGADLAVAPRLLAGLAGWALGDEGYRSPPSRAEPAADGPDLLAPPRGKDAGAKRRPPRLVRTRRRIETASAQPAERYHAERVRARDERHLAARWPRKLVSHTLAVLPRQRAGLAPLAFAQPLTA